MFSFRTAPSIGNKLKMKIKALFVKENFIVKRLIISCGIKKKIFLPVWNPGQKARVV